MMKWKEQLNGDCPRRDEISLHERCDLICPDLPEGSMNHSTFEPIENVIGQRPEHANRQRSP
jgi:hypothetical protein